MPATRLRWVFISMVGCIAVLRPSTVVRAAAVELVSARQIGSVDRVQATLEVGGDLALAQDGKTSLVKMSVVGNLRYHEKLLFKSDTGLASRSVRDYDHAEAAIKIEKGGLKPTLSPTGRVLVMDANEQATTLFSPRHPISREELDLVNIQGNTLVLDRLLPTEKVDVGAPWQHSPELLTILLGLDLISQADVKSEVKSIDEHAVKITLQGSVQGAIGGVVTKLDLKGKYTFDRDQRRITWLALLIKEKRLAGLIGPGLDVVAKLQVQITPDAKCEQLTDEALANLELEPGPKNTLLSMESKGGEFRFLHDRRWFVMSEQSLAVAVRLVERGELIAQCNIGALTKTEPGKRQTLEEFQAEVRRSLDKNFGQFVRATEGTNAAGYTIYQVDSVGRVSDLDIQWRHFLVADGDGRQVVFAFTLEDDLAERFGADDQALVGSLEFVPREGNASQEPTPAGK